MAKLRHIALEVPDAEKSARFFEQAFGMTRVRAGGRSIHLSDGVMNIALLQIRAAGDPVGVAHFGMWVDDYEAAEQRVLAAGATPESGGPPPGDSGFYEAKFRDPDGIVFDLTHSGWPGAVKEVVPAAVPKATDVAAE